jgi:hypothetical protein
MDLGSELKETLESKPKGRRRRGRPRLRWLEDVEKVVLVVEVKLWRQKAVDKEDWGGQGSQRAVEPRSVSEYLKILFESPRKQVINAIQSAVAEKQSLFR